MKVGKHPQGSAGWRRDKLGLPSASNFDDILPRIKKDGEDGAFKEARIHYMAKLTAETLLKRPIDEQDNRKPAYSYLQALQWGIEHEPFAVNELASMQIGELEPIGFCIHDSKLFGATPDRKIRDKRECVEIKCPYSNNQIEYLLVDMKSRANPHYAQVQGQLLVTGYERVHFFSWHPRVPAIYAAIERDEAYIEWLHQHLIRFSTDLKTMIKDVRKAGKFHAYEVEE